MSAKELTFGVEARNRMQDGIDSLANAVKVTLGPRGRHAAIERQHGPPLITKDGVTVARAIELSGSLENMGAQLVKYVASATNMIAGDGTTTATVLAQSIFNEGAKMVAAGYNPVLVKKGLDIACGLAVSRLKELARPVDGADVIRSVASISANNDESLGELIGEVVAAIGPDGLISVEDATGFETSVEYSEGFEIDRGYLSPSLINNADKMTCEMDNPYILVCDQIIFMTQDILELLKSVSETGRPLLIIAKDVKDEALATLVLNKQRGSLNSCAIKAPGFGDISKDMLEDIAALCGANIISNSRGGKQLSSASIDDLGTARKITSTISSTSIIDGGGDKDNIGVRISGIKRLIEASDVETYQMFSWKERLSKLSGGVAILRVGGTTEGEMKERKDRVEDSINAVKAAIEEGVLPGGGSALMHCIPYLKEEGDKLNLTEEESVGFSILAKAISVPFNQILVNSGIQQHDCYDIASKVLSGDDFSGYDALNGCFSDDMMASGVIDPLKVVRTALENANSACGTLLTTEVVISNCSLDKKSGGLS
jgi:chaperonin GroEL